METTSVDAHARCRDVAKKRKIRTEFVVYLQKIGAVLAGTDNPVECLTSTFEFLQRIERLEFDNFCSKFPYQDFWNYILCSSDPVITDNALAVLGKTCDYAKFDPSFIAVESFPFLVTQLTKSKKTCRAVLRLLTAIAQSNSESCRFVYNNCLSILADLPVSHELGAMLIPLFSIEQEPRPEVVALILKFLATDSDLYYWECAFDAMCECFDNLQTSLNQESLEILRETIHTNREIWFEQIDEHFTMAFLRALAYFTPLPIEYFELALRQVIMILESVSLTRSVEKVIQRLSGLVYANRDGWKDFTLPWMTFVDRIYERMAFDTRKSLVKALAALWDLNVASEASPRIAEMLFDILQGSDEPVQILRDLSVIWQSNTGNEALRAIFMSHCEALETLCNSDSEAAEAASTLYDLLS